jgi:hypothetical protein
MHQMINWRGQNMWKYDMIKGCVDSNIYNFAINRHWYIDTTGLKS